MIMLWRRSPPPTAWIIPKAASSPVKEIVKYLTAKYGTPKGNIVDLEGIAGIVAAAQREKGFADVIAKYPDIKVVARADGGFNTDQANAVMTNILPAQPNIDAVYGANDAESYGAITAIKAADRFQPAGKTRPHLCDWCRWIRARRQRNSGW